jgi:F420H(2)-dependent quinone reductase
MTSNNAIARQGYRLLNRFALPAVRSGFGSPFPVGVGLVVLESTGRVSGRARQVPLVATRVGDTVRVSTVRSDSQWLKNLEADPVAAVYQWGRRQPVRASVTRGPLNVATLSVSP